MNTKQHDDDRDPSSRNVDRREFLEVSSAAVGAALVGRGYGTCKDPRRVRPRKTTTPVLVTIFLRGGADALSLVAPTGDAYYAGHRGAAAVGAPGSGAAVEGLAMDATFSMHPSLAGLHAAYTTTSSSLAVVHAVGAQPYNRSHFESQTLFETGGFIGQFLDGWLNRHLKTGTSPQDAVRALALTKTLPRIMAGSSPAYAVDSISDMAFVATAPDARAILEHMLEKSRHEVEGRPIAGVQHGIGDALELIDFFSGVDPTSYLPFNGAVYPTSDLGGRLQEIAQLIRADLGIEFFHADTGGWDHHTSLDTNIATFGGGLDAALSAFLQDLGAMMGSVVVLVMSEFGREVALNGSGGVDHGVGGGMLVMGGSCQGGQVHGTWPGLAPAALEDGRFLAPANDFRDVVLEVLDSHMGGVVPAEVFPGHNYNPLGIM